jgi:hypothetical protein
MSILTGEKMEMITWKSILQKRRNVISNEILVVDLKLIKIN